MKKIIVFGIKCIMLVLLLFGICFFVVMPQYEGGYQAALQDKLVRLKSIDGPRIVLIGNSNLAFGIDSAYLEKELGMPVVNMGLHAGTGNAFNEQAALLNVHPGDIYVISHTNYDDEDIIKNQELVWLALENHFGLYRMIRPKDLPGMVKAYPTYLRKCLHFWATGTGNQESNDCYRRSAFNEYGDLYYPRLEPGHNIDFSSVTINHISKACADRMNRLHDKLSEKGAHMVVAAYPIANYENAPKPEEYDLMQEEMRQALKAEVISDFKDYMYDPSYFYNSHTHLTDAGAKLRSEQLAKDLQAYMDTLER